jgi:hypothetical protein
MTVMKVRRFGDDSRDNIERKIDTWIAKQTGRVLVQRTELASLAGQPVILVTIWCGEDAVQQLKLS